MDKEISDDRPCSFECDLNEKCPTGALFRDEKEKKIRIDNKECSNCEIRVGSCPVDAIKISSSTEEYEKIIKDIENDFRELMGNG